MARIGGFMGRQELYKRFGPQLIEAIVIVLKEEINKLRKDASLSEYTDSQLMTTIENKLNGLSKYEWM